MLQLDTNFRISVDSSKQNFQLEKLDNLRDRKTKEVVGQEWKIQGYHGNSMTSVLKQYVREALIDDTNLETLHNVLDKLNEIDRTIDRVVKKENIRMETKQND